MKEWDDYNTGEKEIDCELSTIEKWNWWLGYLNYENAIAFLTEMFSRWSEANSSHEVNGSLSLLMWLLTHFFTFDTKVTIVLFSRCFYDAESIEDFPAEMRACLVQGQWGFYEDFYRVVVQVSWIVKFSRDTEKINRHACSLPQNERFDDWHQTVRDLTKIFTTYDNGILEHHTHLEVRMRSFSWNSTF